MPRSDNRIALPEPARAGSSWWTSSSALSAAARPPRWLAAITALGLLLAPLTGSAHAAPRTARHRRGHANHHRSVYHRRHAKRATMLLGDAAVEPLHYSLAPGRSEAFRLRAHASGRVGTLRLYIGAASTARAVMVGLYDDSHGRPGVLLAGGSTSALRHGGWSTIRLTPAHHVSAGGRYWLTILADGGTVDYRARRHGRCPRALSLQRDLSALPATASAARIHRHAHCPISAFAVAASASAPGAPVSLSAPAVAVSPPSSNPLSPPTPLQPASPLKAAAEAPAEEKEPPREHKEEPPSEERAPSAPANSNPPAVGGSLVESDVLTSTPGTWSGAPTSYSYRWQDCNAAGEECKAIAGAATSSHTLTAADVGHTLRVIVTATNEGGSTSATSAPTGVVAAAPPPPPSAPTNTKPPTLAGTATQGHALTATKGSWTENPTSFAYQWQDCDASGASCTNIAGAAASSYTLTESDVGHTLRVVVTATNAGGSTPATSAPSAIVAAYSGSSGYPECTQTIGTAANVTSTVSGAAAGAVICLSSGAYGNLSLNGTHSGDVTLQAAPEAHVTAGSVSIAGSHLVMRGLWIDGVVALEEGTSFVTIDHDDISNVGGHGGEGIVFDTSDCTVPNAPTWTGCEPHAPISDVTISHDHIHDIGQGGSEDAIHLDNWRNVTVTGNELDHIIESGNHTDCLQSVYGGENLTFDHNYEHDNDCQGIFIKDGDATNVNFTDNLFLRDHEGAYADFAQLWNIEGLTIQHNTIWDGKGMALVTEDASFTPSATIDHNAISDMSLEPHAGTPYSIAESHDIFGEAPNKMAMGAGDGVVANPQFANTATDDYRLASNPNGIGIDWSPAEQQYGPVS